MQGLYPEICIYDFPMELIYLKSKYGNHAVQILSTHLLLHVLDVIVNWYYMCIEPEGH